MDSQTRSDAPRSRAGIKPLAPYCNPQTSSRTCYPKLSICNTSTSQSLRTPPTPTPTRYTIIPSALSANADPRIMIRQQYCDLFPVILATLVWWCQWHAPRASVHEFWIFGAFFLHGEGNFGRTATASCFWWAIRVNFYPFVRRTFLFERRPCSLHEPATQITSLIIKLSTHNTWRWSYCNFTIYIDSKLFM